MKWSKILHGLSALAGVFGLLALFAWWIALIQGGSFLGMSQEHILNDVITLFLASIAFGIGTLVHLQLENK